MTLQVVNFKPLGKKCNLACDYCYYSSAYTPAKPDIMSFETLQHIFSRIFAAGPGPITLVWHGGEPLLAGKTFYHNVNRLISSFRHFSRPVIQVIQTNGTLIDDEWAQLFAQNGYKIGISIDGPLDNHNTFRHDAWGRASLPYTLRGMEILKKTGLHVNVLVVLTYANISSLIHIYEWLAEFGARNLSIDPCCTPEYLLDWQTYADAVCQLFDYVYPKKNYPKISLFEEIIAAMQKKQSSICWLRGTCNDMVSFEVDGSFVQGCDFLFSFPRTGIPGKANGHGHDYETAAVSINPGNQQYLERNRKKCSACEWSHICGGGCPRYRYVMPGKVLDSDYFCPAYKKIFSFIEKKLKNS